MKHYPFPERGNHGYGDCMGRDKGHSVQHQFTLLSCPKGYEVILISCQLNSVSEFTLLYYFVGYKYDRTSRTKHLGTVLQVFLLFTQPLYRNNIHIICIYYSYVQYRKMYNDISLMKPLL